MVFISNKGKETIRFNKKIMKTKLEISLSEQKALDEYF